MPKKRKVYSVGFTIHEAQNLATDKGQPVDPLVVVRCCGREYRTEVKYAKSNVVSWDESHAWTDIELSEGEWNAAYITFELQAANPFWRNAVLGVASVQLKLIQLRKSHQLKKALPLQNPEDADVHGLLRVTIFACAPGEAPPSPGEEVVEEEEEERVDMADLRRAVIDTQRIQEREPGARLYHLYVTVHRVEDLAPSPSKGNRDPFVTCEFAGCKLKSTQARSCSSHAFNECFRIPVVAPLPEDAILVKVWDWNFMRPDELIAVGRLSFSDLRTRQLLPRWFNFYGFDDAEVAHVSRVAGQGGRMRANFYLGRLLLSARVERLAKDDLMAPHTVAARPHEEPVVMPLILLADVYELQGSPGTKACVEIWCGQLKQRTRWVTGDETRRQQRQQGATTTALSQAVKGALGVAQYFVGDKETSEEDRFVFAQTEGRIPELRLAVPEDYRQQWDVLISVYARGTSQQSGETRIAFQRLKLGKVPLNVPGTPRPPLWIPLYSTPPFESSKPPPALLMTIEKSKVEAVARPKRKPVRYVDHQLRVYVYAARNLLSPSGALPNPFVQVSCAGLVRETVVVEQTSNPIFMDCLRLELPLATDPMRPLPTTPPVVVSLYERRSWGVQFLGRATCHYDRLRGKTRAGEAPTVAEPRWLKLRGGRYANKHIGDVLLLVELVRRRDAADIPCYPMRPAVKMCTLTFSCLGLRNLYLTRRATPVNYIAMRTGQPQEKKRRRKRLASPLIFVSASSYASAGRDRAELLCRYEHHPPDDPTLINKQWRTATLGDNADILSVESMEIDVPSDPLFDPRLVIQVYDRKRKPKYFVGEYSMSLVPLLPWIADQQAALEAIVSINDFTDSLDVKQLSGLLRGFHGREQTQHGTHIGLQALSAADRETAEAVKSACQPYGGVAGLTTDDLNFADSWLLPSGLPKILVASYSVPGVRYDIIYSNMFTLNVYIPAKFVLCAEGKRVADKKTKELYKRPSVQSTLETFLEDIAFPADFLRKAVLNEVDVTGQIKFFVDLTYNGQPNPYVDQDVAHWATNNRRLRERVRGEDAYPKLLKVRVYVIRAISLSTAERTVVPNPYLSFTVGEKRDTLREEAKPKTFNPQFFTVWEKEAAFPEDSQLDVHVWSAEETVTGALDDYYIGTTSIDLEERWFSKEWRKYMEKNSVPMEYRPLRQSPTGPLRGTVEMWVELMDLQKAGEIPKFELQHPAATEVEIRIIIWGARGLAFKALGKDYIDATIRCTLDCSGFRGRQPTVQQTDVHYYSKTGSALFNWRVLYSSIVMPVSTCVLQIAAYDFRNIGDSLFVGEVNLELRKYLESVATRLDTIEVDAELRLINKIKETPDMTTFGFVQVTLQFLPQPEATSKPVGLGRDAPNRYPRLMTPQEGRKWEDVLGSAGLRLDYRPLWFWVRVACVVLLSLWLFIISFLYPSLLT